MPGAFRGEIGSEQCDGCRSRATLLEVVPIGLCNRRSLVPCYQLARFMSAAGKNSLGAHAVAANSQFENHLLFAVFAGACGELELDRGFVLGAPRKNIPLWCDDRRSSSQRGRSFNPWPLIEAA